MSTLAPLLLFLGGVGVGLAIGLEYRNIRRLFCRPRYRKIEMKDGWPT